MPGKRKTADQDLRAEILRLIQEPKYRPLDKIEIADALGYGAARRSKVARAPRFHLPHRDYHLLVGPVEALAESMLDPPWWQSPNLCWPDDRTWCVASEIDLYSTYIGCSEACRDAILSLPEIEALPINPTTGISFSSDTINR